YILLIGALVIPRRDGDNAMLLTVMWMLYAFATIYFAKYIFVIIDLVGKIPTLFRRRRNKLISKTAAICAVITFVVMWWGALINRFRIDVKEVEIVRQDVPADFDGYRIVQISDLHTGTYGSDTTFVSRLVDAINAQNPDVIVFTGDIVNSRSDELTPHAAPLSRLYARDGVYSIMGNHDYGDYANWDSPRQKNESIEYLKQLQASMGWKMLNNATDFIHNGNDSIALIGVENIGDHPFPVYGSLVKAYPTLSDSTFKVLLTHNPAHWCDSISRHSDINIPLSLSGHTHAMQMEVAGVSPAVFRYPTWGGLYADEDSTHMLYVNIGAGTVGIPTRIGATPEITVITLRKTKE
ncbi:MAG: metallophosphoesterase, partial [Duncaniella sp.]|nr:metallophosphoesterase [Duncaniella sp.]